MQILPRDVFAKFYSFGSIDSRRHKRSIDNIQRSSLYLDSKIKVGIFVLS